MLYLGTTGTLSAKSILLSAKQNEFLQAYDSLQKGGLYYGDHLKNYVLYPYLEYEQIKQNLKKTSNQALVEFINRNQQSWLADDLRSKLLVRYAKKKNWHGVKKYYKKDISGITAKCVGLEANARTSSGANQKNTLNQAMKIWLSGKDRPKNCNGLFSLLKQHRLINDQSAWKRIALAMDNGKTSLTKHLAKHTNDKALVSLWAKLRGSPNKHLKNKLLKKDNARTRLIIVYGIKR